jgi:hypothetical protein
MQMHLGRNGKMFPPGRRTPSFPKNQVALKTYLDCLPFPKANADASWPKRQDVSSWAENAFFP